MNDAAPAREKSNPADDGRTSSRMRRADRGSVLVTRIAILVGLAVCLSGTTQSAAILAAALTATLATVVAVHLRRARTRVTTSADAESASAYGATVSSAQAEEERAELLQDAENLVKTAEAYRAKTGRMYASAEESVALARDMIRQAARRPVR